MPCEQNVKLCFRSTCEYVCENMSAATKSTLAKEINIVAETIFKKGVNFWTANTKLQCENVTQCSFYMFTYGNNYSVLWVYLFLHWRAHM